MMDRNDDREENMRDVVQHALHNNVLPLIAGKVISHCTEMNHIVARVAMLDSKLAAKLSVDNMDYAEKTLIMALQYCPPNTAVEINRVLETLREQRTKAHKVLATA